MREAFLFAALMAATPAWALPWNVDMVDSDAVRAYEQVMRSVPEGAMSQANLLTPISYRRNYVRESAEGRALKNPLDGSNSDVQATGKRMYNIYCQPCHGDGEKVGPVGAAGRYPAVAILKGETGRVVPNTDGHLYLTIRNGGGIMPSYSWAMDDREMWSIVAYLRQEMAGGVAPAETPVAPAVEAPATDAAAAPATTEGGAK